MYLQNSYEPRRTFTSLNNDYLSKTGYRGTAHTVHYQTNGTGRDSYIVRDNGGFNKMAEPCKSLDVGTFGGKSQYRSRVPAIHAKNLFYRSNGTGRDSYIACTSGGFNNPNQVVEYRQAFVNSLRQYERPVSAYTKLGGMGSGMRRTASTNTFKHTPDAQQQIKKRDYLLESQLTFDWKYHESQKQLRSSQKTLNLRLSQPKKTRKKIETNTIEY